MLGMGRKGWRMLEEMIGQLGKRNGLGALGPSGWELLQRNQSSTSTRDHLGLKCSRMLLRCKGEDKHDEGINDGCLGSRRNRRKAVESDGLEDWRGLGQDQGIVHL